MYTVPIPVVIKTYGRKVRIGEQLLVSSFLDNHRLMADHQTFSRTSLVQKKINKNVNNLYILIGRGIFS